MLSEIIFEIKPRGITRIEVALPGTPGSHGSKWLSGIGDPVSGTGSVGDWYINNTTKDFFEKTAIDTWTLRGTMGNSVVDWSELTNIPLAFPPDAHAHDVSEINGLLDGDDKLYSSLLPSIAITDTFPVGSQAAMLALDAERGDVAVRSDLNKSFILKDEPASTLANWVELLTPGGAVLSVNGQTGAVTLLSSHIAEGTNLYFTAARVLATLLSGFASGANSPIAATDNILQAFAKAQGQINTIAAGLSGIIIPTSLPSRLLYTDRTERSTTSFTEIGLISFPISPSQMVPGSSIDIECLANFRAGSGSARKLIIRLGADAEEAAEGEIYLEAISEDAEPTSGIYKTKITFHADNNQVGSPLSGTSGTHDGLLPQSNLPTDGTLYIHINAQVASDGDEVMLKAVDIKHNAWED